MIKITSCPTGGTPKIKRVQRNWTGEFHGQSYTVKDFVFHECPVCGEKVYDREAMRRIEEHSPAFTRAPAAK